MVGRYASGGNTYVMFADGSIEAETPQGRFTFASLDELKAFVDAGGEGARGAAERRASWTAAGRVRPAG